MDEKIMIVDDEPNLLSACKRNLRNEPFQVFTVCGPEEGLIMNANEGPFAVIISDYRMPVMDGAQFLLKIQEHSPNTVRMMLTGNTDIDTAIHAINEGHIFRFMNKPCSPMVLTRAINAGIEQYRLIKAEQDLLKNTLTGSIKVLVEILSLVSPIAFSRASRIRRYVQYMVKDQHLTNIWQFEIAAMLSQVGSIGIPSELFEKLANGESLNDNENLLFLTIPDIGSELIGKIPRLEEIASMISLQNKTYAEFQTSEDFNVDEIAIIGAQILKIAIDFDAYISKAWSKDKAIQQMMKRPDIYNLKYLESLRNLSSFQDSKGTRTVYIKDLHFGMIAYEDIRARNGLLLVAKGQEITYPVIVRLRTFSGRVGVVEPFRVFPPGDSSE